MNKYSGGPAFPIPGEVFYLGGDRFKEQAFSGMTLRDYFAAMAMQGILSDHNYDHPAKKLAELAYKVADAMLEEREK